MATNNTGKSGVAKSHNNDKETPKLPSIVIGIVKSNTDTTHSGTIEVYINIAGGPNPNASVFKVRYMSPFLGITSSEGNPNSGSDKSGDGKFVGNPQSYGFWATAPDVGTEVICIFVDGRSDQGYYIGCVPKVGLLQMTPACGASNKIVANNAEATSYGGADRLPTSEVNTANPNIRKSAQIYSEPKPVHSYQAAILAKQGLIRDNIRGVISSSAQRESPSRVFGMSTPGGPIYEGGFTSLSGLPKDTDPSKLKIIGRTGGHSFVMDDGRNAKQGETEPVDQLIRLRSSAGHQILMSDTGQSLFIIHSNGDSWIELGKEGTVDIYATNSFNVRTQGDINFHADNNINLNAAKNINMYAENIKQESTKDFTIRAGSNFNGYTPGSFTFKAGDAVALNALGNMGLTAGNGDVSIVGLKVNLNSGNGPQADQVKMMSQTNHVDTIFSKTVGWMNPSPTPLISIVTRAPAHQPWVGSGVGVDVKIPDPTPTPDSQQTTPAVDAANTASPSAPATPTTPNEVSSAPVPAASAGPLPAGSVAAMTSQTATNAQALTEAAQAKAGVINSATGVTAKVLEASGTMLPGSGTLVTELISKGMPVAKALEGALTGAAGATDASSFATNVAGQAAALQTVISKSAASLTSSGILTGKESPAQAGGPIMAAVGFGVAKVTEVLKGGAGSITGGLGLKLPDSIGSLGDSLASGKMAAGLGDSLKGGLGGLKTSLGGMASDAQSAATSALDNLKSAAQGAFAAVEKSFTALKEGANTLGQKITDAVAPKSEASKSGRLLESAIAEALGAEERLLAAKASYRDSGDPADLAIVQKEEATLAAAKQKVAQSSTDLIKAGTTAALNASKETLSGLGGAEGLAANLGLKIPASTLTSGLNAIPGGAGAMMSVVTGGTKIGGSANPLSAITGMASSAIGAGSSALSDPTKLAGDLMGKTSSSIQSTLTSSLGSLTGSAGSLGDLAAKAKAGAAGIMGQVETSIGSVGDIEGKIKAAVAATGTINVAAITAKTGQLLGDPKIPLPVFSGNPTPPENLNERSAEITAAYEAVEEAGYRVNSAKFNLSLTQRTGIPEKIAEAKAGLAKEEALLQSRQDAYSILISTTSA